MEKDKPKKSGPTAHQRLSFDSTLERIAEGMEYYALSVPLEVSQALQVRAAVPVLAKVNGSEEFKGSLYPVGGGRHYLRVRNQVCKSVGIREGALVRVDIEVRDRQDEVEIPADLKSALRSAKALAAFAALPVGKKSYVLRLIDEAVKPETRAKRIGEAVDQVKGSRTSR
ncbi:MAG: YdeI/OmpD-associated family protein [Myxococcales bacterium]